MGIIHNREYLKQKRKDLRNNGTSAEATLWKFLQKSQLDGRKFRRQHSIGNYIVDFYCPAERLVVELDGQYHFEHDGEIRDEIRTKYLESLGIRIVRFENYEVFETVEEVLGKIKLSFRPPLPPPF
ncbi:MAG TPA: endonuclease domain-containing protein [Cyclobacteriaceae bacterium]|nr:endonuclease domain-containing protein [Cyclobacteriaceae bacterium]HMV09221.1 endonuclease domain-containing protein [Cyclobacteriaceae bacterium]HMV90946.1 endonuclease domain-containing protein [Cyclobacteriaceae bacterium]HMX01410.1 endonuclease domain-containing protein [Cyclobacteriaceae bacterium]HMX50320.1 endonuclease domain-containing protein [Cyclobacteriaceae bacterium]